MRRQGVRRRVCAAGGPARRSHGPCQRAVRERLVRDRQLDVEGDPRRVYGTHGPDPREGASVGSADHRGARSGGRDVGWSPRGAESSELVGAGLQSTGDAAPIDRDVADENAAASSAMPSTTGSRGTNRSAGPPGRPAGSEARVVAIGVEDAGREDQDPYDQGNDAENHDPDPALGVRLGDAHS
jgi:hypothetical protein